MTTTLKFEGATETVSGIAVKDVHFNAIAKAYLGFYQTPMGIFDGWKTAMWNKRGQFIGNAIMRIPVGERPGLTLKPNETN